METDASRATDRAGDELASLAPTIEAILMSVERPVSAGAIAAALSPPSARARPADSRDDAEREPAEAADTPPPREVVAGIEATIAALNASYEHTGRSFRIEHVAGGYRIMTLPQFARAVAAFHRSRQSTRLTKAALEALAIIAYKQPITRVDLEAIRGVACGEVLRSLMDRRLITIKGRAEELGRPLLYGTTKQFLDAFGLASLTDLPQMAELKLAEIKPGTPGPAASAAPGATPNMEVSA